MKIAQVVHKIWCSQNLSVTASYLIFDLHDLIKSSVEVSEYSL